MAMHFGGSVSEEKQVVLVEMAMHFGGSVSDAKEVSLQAGAIPNNTKSTTDFVFGMSGLLADQQPLLVSMELFH